jgi:hypothetical protein
MGALPELRSALQQQGPSRLRMKETRIENWAYQGDGQMYLPRGSTNLKPGVDAETGEEEVP